MINDMQLSTDVAAVNSMDDTELQGIVAGELEDAVSYIDADISPIRAKGTEYYRGDPFGNEEDGRSQVVAMEVRDTVSAMLPSLMKVFSAVRMSLSMYRVVLKMLPALSRRLTTQTTFLATTTTVL
jgi:hypothetical protein